METAAQRLEKRTGAKWSPADAEDEKAIDFFAQPPALLQDATQQARLIQTAMVIQEVLRPIDEAGLERFRRVALRVALGGHLLSRLEGAGLELAQPRGA